MPGRIDTPQHATSCDLQRNLGIVVTLAGRTFPRVGVPAILDASRTFSFLAESGSVIEGLRDDRNELRRER